ncbi:MAG: NUDIX hydrolase [Longimicrobiales bacterium]
MSDPDFIIPSDRLPPGFAERIEQLPEVPAVPRPAATIVLTRPGPGGLEVLLLKRSRSAGFVPGAYVFPGGLVDREDASEDLLARVDGLSPADASARLALDAGADPPAVAYYLAAIREAFEETGILVAHRDDGSHAPNAATDAAALQCRDDLLADGSIFAEVLDRIGCRLDGKAVEYIAHWITPTVEPRRYDTRFFLAAVPEGTQPELHAAEISDSVWTTPRAALDGNGDGSFPMIFPTIKTLEDLSAFSHPSEAIEAYRSHSIRTILPTLVRIQGGVGIKIPENGENPSR